MPRPDTSYRSVATTRSRGLLRFLLNELPPNSREFGPEGTRPLRHQCPQHRTASARTLEPRVTVLNLTPEERERYDRQLGPGVLSEEGQLRLKQATALVTRVGGMGGLAGGRAG